MPKSLFWPILEVKEGIAMSSEFGKEEKKKGHFVRNVLLLILLFVIVGVGFYIGKKVYDVNNKYGITSDEIVLPVSSSPETSSTSSSSSSVELS